LDRGARPLPIEQQGQIRTMVTNAARLRHHAVDSKRAGSGRVIGSGEGTRCGGELIREAKTYMLPAVIQTEETGHELILSHSTR